MTIKHVTIKHVKAFSSKLKGNSRERWREKIRRIRGVAADVAAFCVYV